MTKAADEYLSILSQISSELQDLMTEMPNEVFHVVGESKLPQGLPNNTRDPSQMVQQVIELCRTQRVSFQLTYQTTQVPYARPSSISQSLESIELDNYDSNH